MVDAYQKGSGSCAAVRRKQSRTTILKQPTSVVFTLDRSWGYAPRKATSASLAKPFSYVNPIGRLSTSLTSIAYPRLWRAAAV